MDPHETKRFGDQLVKLVHANREMQITLAKFSMAGGRMKAGGDEVRG